MGQEAARSRGDAAPLLIAVSVGVAVTAAALRGDVRDLGTAGSLASILALPIMVAIFYAARLLHRRMRRSRVASLRRDDIRDRAHVIITINMCRSLALGARGSDPCSPAAMSAMRDVARHIGEARTTYGRFLTEQGMRIAEQVHAAALNTIEGQTCAPADFSHIFHALRRLDPEILDIDDASLVRRREEEAGAGDPGPE